MLDVVAKSVLHGLYVLTARGQGGAANGMAVAWVSQVSLNPVQIMVAVDPSRYTHELIESAGFFGLSAIGAGHVELIRRFGFSSGRETDKLSGVASFEAPNGSPVLSDAAAYVECKVVARHTAGDHTLFIGEPVAAKILDEEQETEAFRWSDFF